MIAAPLSMELNYMFSLPIGPLFAGTTTTSSMGMVMVILGPSPVPPIYLAGSFGRVRPAWI